MAACAAPRGEEETVEGLAHSRALWNLLVLGENLWKARALGDNREPEIDKIRPSGIKIPTPTLKTALRVYSARC
ncbi:hypothetical protein NDU88_006475 [Pleurodeles waltl]|uniref:Uncharacterized protein n=1 Tax=Pleurodeles waltl TaxID=8319 RepID=A0AAV7NZF5_PLEWA|nr:hypothetical protein NDU88_006475 [Pleurodeles waltl]